MYKNVINFGVKLGFLYVFYLYNEFILYKFCNLLMK